MNKNPNNERYCIIREKYEDWANRVREYQRTERIVTKRREQVAAHNYRKAISKSREAFADYDELMKRRKESKECARNEKESALVAKDGQK